MQENFKLWKMLKSKTKKKNQKISLPFPDLETDSESEDNLSKKHSDDEKIFEIGFNHKKIWSKEELQKWVNSRKKNFPVLSKKKEREEIKEEELCIVEKKLRLKNMLLHPDKEKERKIKKRRGNLLRNLVVIKKDKKFLKKKKIFEEEVKEVKITRKKDLDKKNELNLGKNNIKLEKNNLNNNEMKFEEKNLEGKLIKKNLKEKKGKKKEQKKFNPLQIIEHLKKQKEQDKNDLKNFLGINTKNFNYNYIQNKIYPNLVLDQLLQEREYMLQIIDFVTKNNFLQKKNI